MENFLTKQNFRRLLVFSLAFSVLLLILTFFEPSSLDSIRQIEGDNQNDQTTFMSFVLTFTFAVMLVVFLVGIGFYTFYALYKFKYYGRWLYTGLTALYFVPFNILFDERDAGRHETTSLITSVLNYMNTIDVLLSGFLLAVMWLRPVAGYFEENRLSADWRKTSTR